LYLINGIQARKPAILRGIINAAKNGWKFIKAISSRDMPLQ
jgi:hypothetical protein